MCIVAQDGIGKFLSQLQILKKCCHLVAKNISKSMDNFGFAYYKYTIDGSKMMG